MKEILREIFKEVILSLLASTLFFSGVVIVSTKILSDEVELGKLFAATSEIYTFKHFSYMFLALILFYGALILVQRIASSLKFNGKPVDKILELAAHEFHKNTIHFGGVLIGVSFIATYLAFSSSYCIKTIAFFVASLLLFISFVLYGMISKLILNSNIKSSTQKPDED